MKLPRTSGALAVGAGVLAVTGLLAWGLLQDPVSPWQQLPDGSRLRILGVTYGTKHRVVEGQVWQRLLLPILPQHTSPPRAFLSTPLPVPASGVALPIRSRAGLLGGAEQDYETSNTRLVVWLRSRDPRSQVVRFISFEGEDEYGCRFPCENRQVPDFGTGEVLNALVFKDFPRRSATMRVCPVDHSFWTRASPMPSVQLPSTGTYPLWKPQPLPMRAQAGPLTISLTGWTPMRPVPTAEFEVRSGGKKTLAWEPVTVTVSDATGNSRTSLRENQYEPDPRRFAFLGLCNRESTWKLHAEFAPALPPRPTRQPDPNWSPAPQAPPDWRWSGKITAPQPGRRTTGGPRLDRPEVQLEILGAASAGTVPASDWGVARLRCPALRVRVSDCKESFRLTLVRVTDERGRSAVPMWRENPLDKQWDVTLPRPSHLIRPGFQDRSFVLPTLAGAKTLNLEFAAHRALSVEFLVAPP